MPRSAAAFASLVVRVGLSGVFLYAAFGKLVDPGTFAESIDNYRVLPDGWSVWVALTLPPLEVAAALALLTPWLHRGAALCCAVMLGVFAAAMVQALLRGIDLDCGCFGAETESAVGLSSILRNVVLASGAVWVAWRRPASDTRPQPGRT